MTTRPSDALPYNALELSPEACGLPGERELAALAAGYFPEFFPADGGARTEAYKPTVAPANGYDDARGAIPSLSDRGGAANIPRVSRVGGVPIEKIRSDFPILSERINGHPLVWLDNAATTQRPRQVIERISYYYEHENSNVHRGAHTLAARSTDAYEAARAKIARFISAESADNIVFVRGATEGLNLAAYGYVKPLLRPGDEIILTILEHHANIVPWQLVAEETGAVLRVAPVDDSGQIILSEYAGLFNRNTRFVSMTHVSNAIGTVAPVQEMTAIAHGYGVRVCVDGAQSVSHIPIDVSAIGADFFVFSGHKIFGPNGIGVVYGRDDVLELARPWQGGGNMIADVTFERTLYQRAPQKFEAGTGSVADAVGLGAAVDYVSSIGMENIARYERDLLEYAVSELGAVPGLTFIGSAAERASALSFVLEGRGNEEVGKYLNEAGIAVRAGHHCAQPILRRFGAEGTVRPSVAFYNTPEEIELLARKLFELAR
ncbi:MAG: cysteine desulfurase [Synergistaceae bacterium]|jgi:cysteine desulfurase/selenocysteine lyase|nr:cysteine desulfurase [Synergistaceae bacterium]